MREASIRRIERELEQHLIRAPIDGRVAQARSLPIGSVLQTAEVLGAIVPRGRPRAVAFFPVATVGRLHPGQPARLRLEGFPWTQYGTLAATVVAVGNEPMEGRVRVDLVLGLASAPAIPLDTGSRVRLRACEKICCARDLAFRRCSESSCISTYTPVPALRRNAISLRSRRFFHKL